MIAYVLGEVVDIQENRLILESGQMGFQIFVPSTVMNQVRVGERIKVHTYLNVKEDAMQLYGFLSKDELEIYKMLIGVNGIGPKVALAVLSTLSADELRFAILSDDVTSISKTPGLGKKTAQKLILELKDKFSLEDAFEQKLQNRSNANLLDESADAIGETVQALVALGYSSSDALRAVRKIDGAETMDVEILLKATLKQL